MYTEAPPPEAYAPSAFSVAGNEVIVLPTPIIHQEPEVEPWSGDITCLQTNAARYATTNAPNDTTVTLFKVGDPVKAVGTGTGVVEGNISQVLAHVLVDNVPYLDVRHKVTIGAIDAYVVNGQKDTTTRVAQPVHVNGQFSNGNYRGVCYDRYSHYSKRAGCSGP